MADEEPESGQSVTKDIVMILCVLAALLGIVGAAVYGAIRHFASRTDASSDSPAVEMADPGTSSQAAPAVNETSAPAGEPVQAAAATAQSAATTPSVLSIPDDIELMRRTLKIETAGYDVKHIKLTVSNGGADDVILRMPPGIVFDPSDPATMCPYILREPVSVRLEAGISTNLYLPVAGMDHRFFRTQVSGVPFNLTARSAGALLNDFLAASARDRRSWNAAQTGVWILNANISSAELASLSLYVPDPGVPGGRIARPVGDYADIKAAEKFIAGTGDDPGRYPIFAERRQQRVTLLEKLDLRNPADDYRAILAGETLGAYREDGDLMRILEQYAEQHNNYGVRKLAVRNMMAVGMPGTNEQLLSNAQYGHPARRLAAAWTLFTRGNRLALPILAACADQPLLGELCGTQTETAIAAASGTARAGSETMFAYWQRAIGWDSFGEDNYQVETVKRAVTGMSSDNNPRFAAALADTAADDESAVRSACSVLTQFQLDARAFNALCRVAKQHHSGDIRRHALYCLRQFRYFNPNSLCAGIIKSEQEIPVVTAAADLLCEIQYDGYAAPIDIAAQHQSSEVRRRLCIAAGRTRAEETENTVYRLAGADPDEYTRNYAMNALADLRSSRSFELAKAMLLSGDSRKKRKAVECLTRWKGDPRALGMLKPYLNDKEVGYRVQNHMRQYNP